MLSWTRLHAHLNLPPGPVTYGMVRQAAADRLREAEGLDWKKPLPPAPSDDKWSEFAKDVAAMANTAGGLLVYGVQNKPIELTGIDLDKANIQQYQDWAHGYIRPFVDGLDFQPLTGEEGDVLVVHVPASPDAPHLLTGTAAKDKSQRAFFGPYRDDDHTRWMSEAQLARAYRDRFQRQQRAEDALETALAHAEALLDPGRGAALVAAARPLRPLPRTATPPSRRTALRILEGGIYRRGAHSGTGMHVLEALGGPVPGRGLRRWVLSNFLSADGPMNNRPVLVELHHDGTVVLAVDVATKVFPSGSQPEGVRVVGQEVVERAAAELVSLIHQIRGARVLDSSYLITARLTPPRAGPRPFALAYHQFGMELDPHGRRLPVVEQAETELPAGADEALRREVAADVPAGILHQFGAEPSLL